MFSVVLKHYDQNINVLFVKLASSPKLKFTSWNYHLMAKLQFYPMDLNAALTLCFLSPSYEMLVYRTSRHLQAPSPKLSERVEVLTNHVRMNYYSRSLLDTGRVVGPSRLDDLWSWWAGLVVLVAVVGGRAVAALILADVNDHAGGCGRGGVELVLLP